jgi:hypothetical protein
METSQLKNSIDNESNSAQYLGVESLLLLQLGIDFELRPLQGKNCSRRKLHASKEKGCQEKETLTVRETILRTQLKFRKASREKHLSGGFLLIPKRSATKKNIFSENEGLFRRPGRARNADRE